MDSSRSTQRMHLAPGFCNHVGLLLLLTFSICIPGALGCGHSHLRSRRLLADAPAPIVVIEPPPSTTPSSPLPPPAVPPASVDGPPLAPPAVPPASVDGPPLAPPAVPPASVDGPPLAPPSKSDPPPTPPLGSPDPPPPPSPAPPSPSPPPPPFSQPPPPSTLAPGSTWNESEKAGVVIAAIAALLQVAVAAFLAIKRHQMLTAVEYEDFDDDYGRSDPDYRHPEHSA